MAYTTNIFYNEIIQCYKKGDWENILNLQKRLEEGVLLWPKPNKEDLDFIGRCIKEQGLKGVISVGCGSGLLEWLLETTNNLKVTGLEIDSNYWNSKYARKNFIPLTFPQDKGFSQAIKEKEKALMFCYFNDGSAFHEYLRHYQGSCLIIIGPHEKGKFTNPGPFDIEIPKDWQLWLSKNISGTGDYITVYKKKK